MLIEGSKSWQSEKNAVACQRASVHIIPLHILRYHSRIYICNGYTQNNKTSTIYSSLIHRFIDPQRAAIFTAIRNFVIGVWPPPTTKHNQFIFVLLHA